MHSVELAYMAYSIIGENQTTFIWVRKSDYVHFWSENQTSQAFGSDIIQNTSKLGTEKILRRGVFAKRRDINNDSLENL